MRTELLTIVLLLTFAGMAEARTIYVDSRVGNNAYDGTSAEPINAWVGPVRTLRRAQELVCPGDSLLLVDNGTPYYGSLTLFGPKFSGSPTRPFRLIGGGAVISGSKPIHPDSWVELGNNLWRITPRRKGWYQLVDEGAALPRVELSPEPGTLPTVPVDSWGAAGGAIYYRSRVDDDPRWHEFELAEEGTGLTLHDVHDVVISDLTLRHFRIDGINAHDRCENVQLVNVVCQENGRAGLAIGGTCNLTLTDCRLTGNAQYSLLLTELGEATLTGTDYDVAPTRK